MCTLIVFMYFGSDLFLWENGFNVIYLMYSFDDTFQFVHL